MAAAAAAAAGQADTAEAAAPRRATAIRGTPSRHHSRTPRVAASDTGRIGDSCGGSSPTLHPAEAAPTLQSCSTAATGNKPRELRSKWAAVARATEMVAVASDVAARAARSSRLRTRTRRSPASRMCTGCTMCRTTVAAAAAMMQFHWPRNRQRAWLRRARWLRRAGWSMRIGRRWQLSAAMRAAAHAPRPYGRRAAQNSAPTNHGFVLKAGCSPSPYRRPRRSSPREM